jgi:hypothetical protein
MRLTIGAESGPAIAVMAIDEGRNARPVTSGE